MDIIRIAVILFVGLFSLADCAGDYMMNCRPKHGCDFSKCDPIPAHFFEFEGFDIVEYRRRNNYNILCEPNLELIKEFSKVEMEVEGVFGTKGDKGDKGLVGEPGPRGEIGSQGIQGPAGDAVKGEVGDPGPKGERGERVGPGDRGDMGPKGEKGALGQPGTDGIRGTRGQKGSPGVGMKGEVGPQGEIGLQGFPGKDVDMKSLRELIKLEVSRQISGVSQIGQELTPSLSPQGTATPSVVQNAVQAPTRNLYPANCQDVQRNPDVIKNSYGGVFDVFPGSPYNRIKVYCDLQTDGGGWVVFLRRVDGLVDFNRKWKDYVNGFGEPDDEMWLGLENLHKMTKNGDYELLVDLGDWEGNSAYAKYDSFSVASSSAEYRLTLGKYSGTAGDALADSKEIKFSTKDNDNDESYGNCAEWFNSAWWYPNCGFSRLTGVYYNGGNYTGTKSDGVLWYQWKNDYFYSLRYAEMKFRKK